MIMEKRSIVTFVLFVYIINNQKHSSAVLHFPPVMSDTTEQNRQDLKFKD